MRLQWLNVPAGDYKSPNYKSTSKLPQSEVAQSCWVRGVRAHFYFGGIIICKMLESYYSPWVNHTEGTRSSCGFGPLFRGRWEGPLSRQGLSLQKLQIHAETLWVCPTSYINLSSMSVWLQRNHTSTSFCPRTPIQGRGAKRRNPSYREGWSKEPSSPAPPHLQIPTTRAFVEALPQGQTKKARRI